MTRAIANAQPRHHVGAARRASLILVLALVAACGSTTPSATTPVPASASPNPGGSSAAPGASAATAVSDRLATAINALAESYTYSATVTVGGTTVSTAEGRSVNGSSEFTLTSGGKTVTSRAIPPKAWVQQSGGDWVAVSGKVPAGSPIAGLAAPSSATLVSDDAAGLVVDASYPPAALGLAGSKAQRVHLAVAPDGAITVTYETALNGSPAASSSVFKPASGLDPITAPS